MYKQKKLGTTNILSNESLVSITIKLFKYCTILCVVYFNYKY